MNPIGMLEGAREGRKEGWDSEGKGEWMHQWPAGGEDGYDESVSNARE